jgi:hypothetical protein
MESSRTEKIFVKTYGDELASMKPKHMTWENYFIQLNNFKIKISEDNLILNQIESIVKNDPLEEQKIRMARIMFPRIWLESEGVGINEDGANRAIEKSNYDVLDWLGDQNVFPDEIGALHAVENLDYDILDWLGDQGIFPDEDLFLKFPCQSNERIYKYAIEHLGIEIYKVIARYIKCNNMSFLEVDPVDTDNIIEAILYIIEKGNLKELQNAMSPMITSLFGFEDEDVVIRIHQFLNFLKNHDLDRILLPNTDIDCLNYIADMGQIFPHPSRRIDFINTLYEIVYELLDIDSDYYPKYKSNYIDYMIKYAVYLLNHYGISIFNDILECLLKNRRDEDVIRIYNLMIQLNQPVDFKIKNLENIN